VIYERAPKKALYTIEPQITGKFVIQSARTAQDVVVKPVAVCVFSVITAAELQTDVRLSIPVLYSAFSKRAPDNDVARITDLEPPEVCTLPAGRAVRLRRLYERDGVTSRLERWFAETYVLPIGTSGDAAGVLQFCTTNVGLAAEFSGQFARYAETFTLFGPGDPTEMNTPPEDD
jgi:hypothetical protein